MPFPAGSVNAYLLTGEPLTLVDPGPKHPETLAALERELADRGLRVEDVELVLLTHQHLDHVGLAETVRVRSGCRVAGHALLGRVLEDVQTWTDREDEYQAALLRLHGAPESIAETAFTVSAGARKYVESVDLGVRLAAGDDVVAGGRTFEVVLRPGHSPSDTIFVDRDDEWALVGDHLLAHAPTIALPHYPIEGDPDPRRRASTLIEYMDSLEHTAALELAFAAPGHGATIESPSLLVPQRIAFHREQAEKLLTELGDVPSTAWELTTSLRGEVGAGEGHPLTLAFVELSMTLGHLDLLEAEDRVRVIEAGDVLAFERVRS